MFRAYIILLVACFSCFVINRKKIPVYLTPLGLLIGLVLLKETGGYLLKTKGYNTKPLDHLYQFVEMWLLCLAYHCYYKLEFKPGKMDKIILATPVALSLPYIFISFYAEGVYNECVINFLINSVLIILLSTHFFYKLYLGSTEINVLQFGFFWINAGNLLYASGTFFQMGLYTYVKSINPAMAEELKIINHVLNYFLYANYLAAFLCTKKYSYS